MSERGGALSNNGRCKLLLLLAFAIILSSILPSTYAFGVATPFLVNDTIQLEPGQQYQYIINIQNGDKPPFEVDFKYSSDRNIASLQERNFTIPGLTYDNPFIFDIQIPKDSIPGEVYVLTFSARPILNLSGQVPMNIEIKRTLTVKIVEKGGEGYILTTWDRIHIWTARHQTAKHYIIIALVLLVILGAALLVIIRMWRVSRTVSSHIANIAVPLRAQKAIHECESIADIHEFIRRIPKEAFLLEEIREMIARRCEAINERFIAQKIRNTEDREDILALLNI